MGDETVIRIKKDDIELKGDVIKKMVKPFGKGSGYIPFSKRYVGKTVYVVVEE